MLSQKATSKDVVTLNFWPWTRPWGKHSLPSLPVKQECCTDGAGKMMQQSRN